MTFFNALAETADRFVKKFESVKNNIEIPTEDYGWENYRYISPLYRSAHVEKFFQDRFAVVHVCVFPHINDPSPIYGFDVIAGENKATGLFFDLSPTVNPVAPFSNVQVNKFRERPPWGDIFGEHWVACRPSLEEFNAIADDAILVLGQYLQALGTRSVDTDAVVCAQNHYCQQQKKNAHTRTALNKLLGTDRAQQFMDTVLFPEVRD